MSEHSFGHGDTCFYCGTQDPDKPVCDESLHKHATPAELRQFKHARVLEDEIDAIGLEASIGLLSFEEALERFQALRGHPGWSKD